jgi:integrase/recombinase XerC
VAITEGGDGLTGGNSSSASPVWVAEPSRYLALRQVGWRVVIPEPQSAVMERGGIDRDLLEYVYWARSIRGLSDNTIRVRMDLLYRLSLATGRPLRTLSPADLQRFERMAIAGRSAETRRAYCCHLRAFYRWLKTTEVITTDPSAVLTIPVVPRHLPRPIAEDDLADALEAARPKMRAMLTLAAYAGLRCIEIAGLDWADLHREQDGSTYIHVRKGKGAKERNVEVGQVVVNALRAYGIKRRGHMFLGLDGKAMDARSVSRSGNRYLANRGVHATMHQLRHRFGSMAYQLSRDLRMVQEQLGHASPQTTAGYARPSADAAARMIALMDRLPGPRTGLDPAGAALPA